jgi:hypothetical protein
MLPYAQAVQFASASMLPYAQAAFALRYDVAFKLEHKSVLSQAVQCASASMHTVCTGCAVCIGIHAYRMHRLCSVHLERKQRVFIMNWASTLYSLPASPCQGLCSSAH